MRKTPLLAHGTRGRLDEETSRLQQAQDFDASLHPAEVAEALASYPPSRIWDAIEGEPDERRSLIFSHLDADLQVDVAVSLGRSELASLLSEMAPDDRVDLFKRIPGAKARALLPAMAHAQREYLRRLAAWPEGSAGSIMTSEYAVLPPYTTAARAIAMLREEAPDKETIYLSFIVDAQRRLVGQVSLKDLILAPPRSAVRTIMNREVAFVRAMDDREEAARLIAKYDLLALPVVNEQDALVGIITHDDAMDVMDLEYTEDMEKFMAIVGRHEDQHYLRTPVLTHFAKRAPWIIVLAALGMVSGMVVTGHQGMLASLVILAAFMPMLADTGGNTGSQFAALIIRGLALGQISAADTLKVLWKELRVALLLSVLLGFLTFIRVLFFSGGPQLPAGVSLELIGGAIALALSLQVVSATLIGALLPIAAAALKLDPAVAASPALTTIVDITGLLIYFTTVTLLVPM